MQRIYFRFQFRNYDIYKWHLNGTFFCRKYKIKAVEIINHLNPKIYIDIGCGLGEVLHRVNLESSRKLGYDIDLRLKKLIPIIFKKDFKFFYNENSLYKYANKLEYSKDDVIVISMLNFIHNISQNNLIKIIEKNYKKLGKYILIIDNIFVKSEVYKYNHHSFLINHNGLIKYWTKVDNMRSLYCIQIG
jgi:SAM-dependent methyltransferase